jgi:high frequency lysogenization protein
MNTPLTDRTLALAAIFQAARLTQQLARDGRCEADAFGASIRSILKISAPGTEEIYGGAAGVALGLRILRDKLTGKTEANDVEIARYAIAMIHLANQLYQRRPMQDEIRRGIETAESQMKFFEAGEESETMHPKLVEKLAELYAQTISTLSPRIIVNGEQGHLANPQIAAKVRAALLAGIRSAFLWHQLGGSRWQLLFSRRKITAEADRILKSLRGDTPD